SGCKQARTQAQKRTVVTPCNPLIYLPAEKKPIVGLYKAHFWVYYSHTHSPAGRAARGREGERVATAKRIPVQQYHVELTLTQEEAETLQAVMVRVGGDPCYSPRRHTAAIALALEEAGIKPAACPIDPDR